MSQASYQKSQTIDFEFLNLKGKFEKLHFCSFLRIVYSQKSFCSQCFRRKFQNRGLFISNPEISITCSF